jgi:hypothetical protein
MTTSTLRYKIKCRLPSNKTAKIDIRVELTLIRASLIAVLKNHLALWIRPIQLQQLPTLSFVQRMPFWENMQKIQSETKVLTSR